MSCLFNTFTRESIAQEMTSGSGEMMMNESCPMNIKCQDLPANCINCQFNENCTYGQLTNVTCTPLDHIMCEVRGQVISHSQSFHITPSLNGKMWPPAA